jgi:two-component system, OmpR family, KDP operon response regulator KdpE
MNGHADAIIAVVEDDSSLRRALRTSIRARGYEVKDVALGEEAIVLAADGAVDVMLLDLGLPDLDGLTVLQRIRTFSSIPIIVLTARDRQGDKIRALDSGADDYVTKPFDIDEVLARVRAALRRAPAVASGPVTIVCDDIEIDLALRQLTVAGHPTHLTRTEWAILEQLVGNAGKLLTHTELLRRVWGTQYSAENEYLRVYIGQLRKKLRDAAASPRFILTEAGIGYRWIGVSNTDS